ncbi:MAG TPA: glycosyltransferase, partial [Steroidobacteraceae bacterium]|nr:glycosyltransferase [Steroidobacteraceae bacterium]
PLYCSVNLDQYCPRQTAKTLALGYLGTYSADRQGGLERLLNETARILPSKRFAVVGAQYPEHLRWPANVERSQHLPPDKHAEFYSRQQFTLNLTRADMRKTGYSPSVRLFEAAACGTPIISDDSPGLNELFTPGDEILFARDAEEVVNYLLYLSPSRCRDIGEAARDRVFNAHSSVHRAAELEHYLDEQARDGRARPARDDRVARAVVP